MLFVSRFSNLNIVVRPALVQRGENEMGQVQMYTVRPQLDAQFRPMLLTEPQRIIAVRMFTNLNPKSPWGAVPYEIGGVMGQEFGDLIMDTESYSGFNPAFNLARFDTAQDIPFDLQLANTEQEQAELRKIVEERLLSTDYLNVDYVRLDESLPKPWPNFPMETGPGVAKKIVASAREFGISFAEIVEFEKTQDKPRTYVIAEIELELAKQRAAEAERAALGAVVA